MSKPYRRIGLGGTFDHFHVGHRTFLDFAAELADELVVGVTQPELVTYKTASEQIESYEQRARSVRAFLADYTVSLEVVPLVDPYGPTLTDPSIDAIAVTEETVAGADAINTKRAELGLHALPVHVCTLIRDRYGELVSSTRIRLGEVNRDGDVYLDLFDNDRVLTPTQSQFFKPRQGPVIDSFSSNSTTAPIVVVGDIVTETFLRSNWPCNLAVYDRRTLREEYASKEIPVEVDTSATRIMNPPGTIRSELAHWLSKYFRSFYDKLNVEVHTDFVYIDGEEDLVTVVSVILAPLGSTIVYGQPNEGMVQLTVTEKLKQHFVSGITA